MADSLFGVNWNLNRNRSLFSTQKWNPETETRLYEEVPGGYKLTVSGTRDGKPYSWHYTAMYDGKGHPVFGRPDADSIQAYRVNDLITLGFFKKAQVASAIYVRQVSADGKTLTVQAAGKNPDGSAYWDVLEYNR